MSGNNKADSLLSNIFIESKTTPKSYIPIIKSSDKIPQIISFLIDNKNQIKEKIGLISSILSLFKLNKNLVPFFKDKCVLNRTNIFEPLINLYLDEKTTNDDIKIIEEITKIFISNLTTPKITLEYIYQRMSIFFTKGGAKKDNNNKELLNEKKLIKYLKILNLFYGEDTTDDSASNQDKNKESSKNKMRKNTFDNTKGNQGDIIPNYKIKNYIYFNGKNSILNLKLNQSSKNINTDFPTLEFGFSFIFWIYVKNELLENYSRNYPSNVISLVNIGIVGHKIQLILKRLNLLQIVIDDKEIGKCELTKTKFIYNDWNFMCFYLTEKNRGKSPSIKLLINDNKELLSVELPNNLPFNEIITSISLFENFLGRITSVLFFSFCLDIKVIDFIRKNYTKGFFKNKYLYNFLSKNDKDYFKNAQNFKYINKYKKEKVSLKLINTNFRSQNIKNLMVFFCPFTYNQNEKYIDDIFGHFLGVLGINDGVCYYENYGKSIKELGGIDNLLPIAELMVSTNSKSKKISYPLVDKNILTASTFLEYLNIFKKILINHHGNLMEALDNKVFSKLGLFLEKFPSEVFTEDVLNILVEIGKETFQFSYEKIEKNNTEDYLSLILLNEKIISKFNSKNQLKLWESLYHFFTSDYSQIKENINMSKICLLLRFYDENRYNEYCCSSHAKLFISNNKNNNLNKNEMGVMNPDMNVKTDKFFDIIQLYVDKIDMSDEEINLFKLLSLDLSPCLQKKIINIYIKHFSNQSVPDNIKSKTIQNLINNNFYDIFEYVLSISLIDIRIELFNLLNILLKDYNKIINTKLPSNMKNINDFIGENVLPEQLIVEVTNDNKSSNTKSKLISKTEYLSKYFNKTEYEKQIENLWKLLKSLIFKNRGEPNKKTKKLEINELFINFCIYFVSKNIITNYIYEFLLLIEENFKKKEIDNLYVLYESFYLYKLLIETIFYFNTKEITKDSSKKDLYEKIKAIAVKLLQELFINSKDLKNKLNKIKYILFFSYKLKNISNNNKSELNEIEFITRYVLKILLDNENINKDLITISCYEFIIFFKDCDKYVGDVNAAIKEEEKKMSNEIKPSNDNDNFIRRNFTTALFGIKNDEMILDENDNKNNDDNILNIKIKYIDLIKKNEVIPECIYESLYYFGDMNLKNGKPNKTGPIFKIWKDFPFYEKIINYYSENIWGLEKICKNIKENPKKPINELYPKLMKEYGENKSYRNLLYQEMIKILNLNDTMINEEYPINILSINIQLLAIAYNIANESKEKEKIETKIHHLIIYCIMSSININSNEKLYEQIQDKLFDILGFALLIIRKQNPTLYKNITDNLILKIFEQVYSELNKSSILKFFGSTKSNISINCCIFQLFTYNKASQGNDKVNIRASAMLSTKKTLNKSLKRYNTDMNSKDSKDELIVLKADEKILLKHAFQYSLIYFRNQRIKIKIEDLKTLYKYSSKSNDIDSHMLIDDTKERKRVNKAIKKLLPLFENQIIKYSNTSYLSIKKTRNYYKSTKRMLFSWSGFWSNRYLFYEHPENLKLKRMNHFTKEMTQLLMKPILDIDYYLPNFTKFDKSKLFNDKNYSYQINLDIDDILLDGTLKQNDKEKDLLKTLKNSNGFNYLECIYKYSYEGLWDKYESFHKQKKNIEKVGSINKASYDILVSNKELSKDIKKLKVENIYYCCMVKITHHIRGYASTEKNKIIFMYESEEYHTKTEIENDTGYDKDMSSCFGSIFKGNPKDKDIINFEINYLDIKYMFIKVYFYNISAIEIYTESNKSYLLTFKNNKDLSRFTNDILSHAEFVEIKIDENKNKVIGYESIKSSRNKKTNINYATSKYEEWRNYNISTFELLMWLNILSGRSFNDTTQYPVFPWIITNYNTDEINQATDMRNLTLSMGMLEINDKSEVRIETFKEIYESVKNDLNELDKEFNYQEYLRKGEEYYDIYLQKKFKNKDEGNMDITYVQPNQIPYFFGTHYSNPTYVSHYLTRIFPFSLVAIEIQGEKFDDPDRLFTSMKKTFESATTLKDDVRELIPEFYSFPEMFLNINNLNLSQNKKNAENKIAVINDVELPPWTLNFPYNFVIELRKNLENDKLKINQWLDLIFGIKQKGTKAEEANNIFMGNSYQGNVKIDSFKDIDTRNTLLRLVEVGVTPLQLFDVECKPKIDKNIILTKDPIYINSKGKLLYESSNIIFKNIKTSKFKRICEHFYYNKSSSSNKDYKINIYPKIVKINWINKDFIKLITSNNFYYSLKVSKFNENLPNEESELCEIDNQSSKFSPSYLISGIDIPIIVYNNNKYMIKGGFWDGRVEINSIFSEEKFNTCIFPNNNDQVVVMELSKDDKLLLCGTKKGFIIAYSLENNNFNIIGKLFNHNDEITSISINDNLNMFGTTSKDGCIMLYTLPKFKLVRTIKITLNNNDKENESIFGNNIFLSSIPIPCVTVFISSLKLFKTYSINGIQLFENNETGNSTQLKCSKIIHDLNFQEFLIYGTNDGFIKIRKFPDMSLINTIDFLEGKPIETFALSQDQRFCYTYGGGDNIIVAFDEKATINEDLRQSIKKDIHNTY